MQNYQPNDWSEKQIEFYRAMLAYENQPAYAQLTRLVSFVNVALQCWLLGLAWFLLPMDFQWYQVFLIVVTAFLSADFVNGLVHLIMDNNDAYTSKMGPFVATFHLHHDTPRYQDKPLWRVYLDESGYKIWLAVLLVLSMGLTMLGELSAWLILFVAVFAIFSSLEEVSHFLCHNSQASWVVKLQKHWFLLPRQHHMLHHRLDNINYAFLNGMTDPLINTIARHFFAGYKTNTDKHTALYQHQKQICT